MTGWKSILAAKTCAALAALSCASIVSADQGAPLPAAFRPYLEQPDVTPATLTSLPEAGSPQDEADRVAFRATRAMAGTPRWQQAQADAGKGVLQAFSCPARATLGPDTVPLLVKLLSRYRTDLMSITHNALPRPYQRDPGAVCLSDKALANAATTPTLQSAWGWTIGLILAEARPARSDALMVRARAYGDSAALCGFASPSEVTAGRDLASALLARMRALPDFRADLDAALTQIAALPQTEQGCPP
jgi:acid phosphatase (class A)